MNSKKNKMEESSKYRLPGITEEMIKKATDKYGDKRVKFAEIPVSDETDEVMTVLVRKPDRVVLGEFQKWLDKNPNKAEDILVKNCLLSHKDEVIADEGLFAGALDAISQLITARKARIKNL